MWSPPHPVSLPFHIFFQLQGSLFMQSSSPLDLTSLSCLFFKATSSAPVLCSARAPFYDPCLISVSSCWLATQISTSRYSINILVLPLLYLTINNNHSHPPAQFLSLLKFNPQCLIHIDVLTDLNRCSLENMTSKFLALTSSSCTGLTCRNFKESPILREANIQNIRNLLEM